MLVKIENVATFDLSKVESIEFTKRLGRYCMDFQWLDSINEEDGQTTLVVNSVPIFFEDRASRKNAYLKLMYAKAKGETVFESTRRQLIDNNHSISIRHKAPPSIDN